MRCLFITATDTGAGKTYVTAALARALHRRRADFIALKPVASGLDRGGHNEDIDALLTAQGLSDADAINLYRLALPAAPMLAAAAEGEAIDLDRLGAWCQGHVKARAFCLIEGVGGLMVPLADGVLVRDWLAQMPKAETVLVIGARLGCMNQALLTLAELARMGRSPAWIIFNALDESDMASQCQSALRSWLPKSSRCLRLPYGVDPEMALLPLLDSLS